MARYVAFLRGVNVGGPRFLQIYAEVLSPPEP